MQREKICDHIVKWLTTYAKKINCSGFVVGISGGVDSAVTSTLCAKTKLNVLAVEMPIHSAKLHRKLAKSHIDFLKNNFANVDDLSLDLSTTFDHLKNQLPVHNNEASYSLALANMRARLRMTTLYYLAGTKNYLVVGTGNKIEDFGIGFFTKYGDGGVDISPIADLLKSEVYDLADYLKIDPNITSTKPTDGLFDNDLTDEDQIGASYPELEWAMKKADEGKTSADFKGRKREVFEIYKARHQKNKHKWNPIPICKIPLSLK